eukprot:c11298_g2_i1.p1 GENE.c11298_g2_i1~~c11298_g2_i1.p1  ORF type:complete len:201 (+),score=26.65 c11298_g2_i1:152-754(+)
MWWYEWLFAVHTAFFLCLATRNINTVPVVRFFEVALVHYVHILLWASHAALIHPMFIMVLPVIRLGLLVVPQIVFSVISLTLFDPLPYALWLHYFPNANHFFVIPLSLAFLIARLQTMRLFRSKSDVLAILTNPTRSYLVAMPLVLHFFAGDAIRLETVPHVAKHQTFPPFLILAAIVHAYTIESFLLQRTETQPKLKTS